MLCCIRAPPRDYRGECDPAVMREKEGRGNVWVTVAHTMSDDDQFISVRQHSSNKYSPKTTFRYVFSVQTCSSFINHFPPPPPPLPLLLQPKSSNLSGSNFIVDVVTVIK